MRKFHRILPLLLALTLLAACAGQTQSPSPSVQEPTASPSPSPEEPSAAPSVEEPSPSPEEVIDLPELTLSEFTLSETILQNSLVSTGDPYRFAKAFAKAAAGEEVIVAAIGGSITEGMNASNKANNCYAAKLVSWMQDKFSNNKITLINAGESGTPSKLGVMRVQKQVLDAKPDIVFVEFAVNDGSDADSNTAYEGLVRKILNSETEPAVGLLFTVNEVGYSNQPNMAKTGEHYGLPMVSIPDSIYAEVQAGNMLWDDYSNDDVHPHTEGHAMVGELLAYCMEAVYEQARTALPESYTVPADTVFGDRYENIVFLNQTDEYAVELGSFTEGTDDTRPMWHNGWKRSPNGGNEPFVIEVTAKEVFMIYWATPGYGNPAGGKADVSVNGGEAKTVNAGGSWGSPLHTSLWKSDGDAAEAVNISVQMNEESDANPFWILGIAYIP